MGDIIDLRQRMLRRAAEPGNENQLVVLDCIQQGLAIDQLWPGVADRGTVTTFMRNEPHHRFVIRSGDGEEREFLVSELPDALRFIPRVGKLPKEK